MVKQKSHISKKFKVIKSDIEVALLSGVNTRGSLSCVKEIKNSDKRSGFRAGRGGSRL